MEVKNHILYEGGKPVRYVPTPNLSSGVKVPIFIVAHYDAAPNATSAINWMTTKGVNASADLHIDRAGNIVQLAAFNKVTWHAGASEWKGYKGLNRHSVGIEMQNRGGEIYTDIQIEKFIAVCKALKKAYSIKEIVGHDQIATPAGRKVDPGKQFPMVYVRTASGITSPVFTTSNLNLRLNPSVHMPVLQVLKKGSELEVLWQGDGWAEVVSKEHGTTGWVSSEYIK